MGRLDGWSNWEVAFFRKLFFAGKEIVFDLPSKISYPRQSNSVSKRNLAGTHLFQAFWFGGDAPVNLSPISPFDLAFQPDSMDEYLTLQRQAALCTFAPQDFFPGVWIEDQWYIPTGMGATFWQTSRNIGYDLVDINEANGDYLPKASIDDTPQTIITAGSPAAGEVLVTPDAESGSITTPALIAGTWLKFFYPAKFLISKVTATEEIPDNDDYTLGLSMEEFLPTRNYNFSIP